MTERAHVPWAAEYRDTIEAEQLRRNRNRPPMSELPEPEPEPPAPLPPPVPAPMPPRPAAPVLVLRGMCVYCGHGPTQGVPPTCWAHRGLDELDPHYNPGSWT